MKYFVVSDIHGAYKRMKKGLANAGYNPSNPNHQLVSLGDNFGRSCSHPIENYKMWKYLTNSSLHTNKPICVRGNHEQILLDILTTGTLGSSDIYNGEGLTVLGFGLGANIISDITAHDTSTVIKLMGSDSPLSRNLTAIKKTMFMEPIVNPITSRVSRYAHECGFVDWLESLPYYFETPNFIGVHSYIPVEPRKDTAVDEMFIKTLYKKNYRYWTPAADWRNAPEDAWELAIWGDTNSARINHNPATVNNKTLIAGHWYTFLHRGISLKDVEEDDKDSFKIFKDEEHKFVCIDQCTPVEDNNIEPFVFEEMS